MRKRPHRPDTLSDAELWPPVTAAVTTVRPLARPAPEVRRARRATAVVFAVHGCVTGSFAARLPWIASHVGVGVGRLGLALLMIAIGAMLAMPFSGRLAHRFELRPLVTVTIAAWCACLVLPSLAGVVRVALRRPARVRRGGGARGHGDERGGGAGRAGDLDGRHVELSRLLERRPARRLGRFRARVPRRHRRAAPVRGRGAGPGCGRSSRRAVPARRPDHPRDQCAACLRPPDAPCPPHRPRRSVRRLRGNGRIDWSAVYIRNELGGSASTAAFAVSAFASRWPSPRPLGTAPYGDSGPSARSGSRGRVRPVAPWPSFSHLTWPLGSPDSRSRDRSRARRAARLRRGGPRRRPTPGTQHRRRRGCRLRQRPRRTRRDRRRRRSLVPDRLVLSRRLPRCVDGLRSPACSAAAARPDDAGSALLEPRREVPQRRRLVRIRKPRSSAARRRPPRTTSIT